MEIRIIGMRLTGPDKQYYRNQLQIFADAISDIVETEIVSVSFGKETPYSVSSITLTDKNHCIPMQKYFTSKDALLGFVVGYNLAKSGSKYI